MRIAVFSTKPYDREFLAAAARHGDHELVFFEPRLTAQTAQLAQGFPVVCAFVNDVLDAEVQLILSAHGLKLIAMRCAGFNNVDLRAAGQLGIAVARVPAYSPQAVAEHTVCLILALCRKLHKAYNRVREGNFSLDGLLGLDLHDKTVGIIGTGKIGAIVARVLAGFGCRLLAYDVQRNPEIEAGGGTYVALDDLFSQSDIVTLHCPLVPQTYHVVNEESLARMKRGVMIVNTSRGALIDTQAALRSLKSGKIGSMGLDVYEEEADIFFEDLSDRVIQDDVFSRMLTFPNVIITGHQAFFTRKAMEAIAAMTLENISAFARGDRPPGLISTELLHG